MIPTCNEILTMEHINYSDQLSKHGETRKPNLYNHTPLQQIPNEENSGAICTFFQPVKLQCNPKKLLIIPNMYH